MAKSRQAGRLEHGQVEYFVEKTESFTEVECIAEHGVEVGFIIDFSKQANFSFVLSSVTSIFSLTLEAWLCNEYQVGSGKLNCRSCRTC